MKKQAQALLLGALLGACGAPIEPEKALEPTAEQPFGRVRAAVSAATPETLSLDLRNDTARVFPADRLPINGDVDFIDNQDNNLLVQQNNSEVFVTYMSTSAQYNSTLAYFTYPDGSPPTTAPTLTQSNVVFASSQNLAAGTRVSLGVFNAGTRVGLVLLPGAGASNPPNLSGTKYYSVNSLNGGGAYFTAKYHKAEQRRVIGIEDSPVGSSSYDLNDLIISVSSSPKEKPRRMTICSYSFNDSLSTGWRYRTWVPSDCTAGLPPSGSIAIGSPQNDAGDSRQMADCQLTYGGHYLLPEGSGLDYIGNAYPSGPTYRTVSCAYVLPNETSDIRTCSYSWPQNGTGNRTRTWQASDCPQGLPEAGSWAVGQGLNGNGTGGQVDCALTSGLHHNHSTVNGSTSATVKCLYMKPTVNNDNLTICAYRWLNESTTGWRTRYWQDADCSNGKPKPGARAVGQAANGNATQGDMRCTPEYGAHYNHPVINGPTTGAVYCLFMNP
jgi:hypothetical protein